MGKYRHDMSNESAPKVCLPKGWRRFEIESGEEQTSKKGNPMFKFSFFDIETQTSHDVYAVSTQGKRWFLKMILTACDVPAGQDGVYDWDLPDVIGKIVQGRIDHEQNEWIDRNGKSHSDPQSKIVEVREDVGDVRQEVPAVDLDAPPVDEAQADGVLF